ncbi:YpmS family protein [Bacillus songklensis]|uniref:YpmS family protein n=1 Tax=Bacillus songklensis TaxID=1069116 RepID=A0ABV8B6S1_9BACI
MNKWKWLFIGLLAINLLFLLVIGSLALQPSKGNEPSIYAKGLKEDVSLGVIAKKKDLNVLINEYLQKEFNNQPLNYVVRLTDQVEVYGTVEAFGNDLDISMDFEPEVQKNGDLLLNQKSLAVGRLQLPVRTVLGYVNNNFSLPEWVRINPREESVYVALQEMEMKSDFRVKVKKFDLEKDDIQFTLISTK